MFSRLLSRRTAGDAAAGVAESGARLLLTSVEDARAAGKLAAPALPLYLCLISGSVTLFRTILAAPYYQGQLRALGSGTGQAAVAAYLQIVGQRVWDVAHEFAVDPSLAHDAGQDFASFVNDFVAVTRLDPQMVANLVNAAEDLLQASGGDAQAVYDRQTFDFLQTLTDGRFTVMHWEQSPLSRAAAQRNVRAARLDLLRVAKEQLRRPPPAV